MELSARRPNGPPVSDVTAERLYSLNTATWTFDKSLMVQTQGMGELYEGQCPFYLIEHPEGLVAFDTGISRELVDDPASYGPYGAEEIADFMPAVDLDAGKPPEEHLDDLGYVPGDVDHLVCSHLHVDHSGNIDVFDGAEVLVAEDELGYAFHPDPVQRVFYLGGDFAGLRSGAYDLTPTTGRFDLFGDGSVELIPTPGHTPGHQSLKVELPDAGTVILAADVALLRAGYEHELAPAFNWSLSENVRSMRRLKQLARETDAEVVIHHDEAEQAKIPDDGLA